MPAGVRASRGRAAIDPVLEALILIRSTLGRAASFDPATDSCDFTVMASDYAALVVVRELVRELPAIAPQVRLNMLPLRHEPVDLIRRGQCDLMLCSPAVAGASAASFSNSKLVTDRFVGVVAEDNPDVVGHHLSAERVSKLPYVHVTGLPPLPRIGHTSASAPPRSTVATTETFTCAAHMLPGTRMFTVVQQRLFARFAPAIGLRAVELAFPFPAATELMCWHPRFTADPGHQWLRSTLQRLVTRLD